MEPLPEHLSHLIYAEEVEPKQEGESEKAYLHRLEKLGYQVRGHYNGKALLGNFDGRLTPRVKPN